MNLLRLRKDVGGKYSEELQTLYGEVMRPTDGPIGTHQRRRFEWLVKASSQEDLVTLAKKMALVRYKKKKLDPEAEAVAVDTNQEEINSEDETWIVNTEAPMDYPVLKAELVIDSIELRISNKVMGSFVLNAEQISFGMVNTGEGTSWEVGVSNWNGVLWQKVRAICDQRKNSAEDLETPLKIKEVIFFS